jgi:hypothetical protein
MPNPNLPLPTSSSIDPDEHVVFFPTVAHQLSSTTWRIPIHGWIYQPTELSHIRRAGVHLVKWLLRLPIKRDDPNMPLFRHRMGALLVDNERNQRIQIDLCGSRFDLQKSRPNGHFKMTLNVEACDLTTDNPNWIPFRAVTRTGDERSFVGRTLLLPPEGLSVISDIDDTIKVTDVLDRRKMLHNTFLSHFAAVPEMADLYRQWKQQRDAAFHYVSASPWHLYPFLSEFLAGQEFPAGSFHLRDFRLMGSDLPRAFRSSARVKSRHIQSLLESFPRRRFILVGDSGEHDADIYAHFTRTHPHQIEKLFIRNVTNDPPDSPRWRETFQALSPHQWQVFDAPLDIEINQ